MERPISDVASPVNEILAFVRGPAQAKEIRDVERHLLSLVMAVARCLLRPGHFSRSGAPGKGRPLLPWQGQSTSQTIRDRTIENAAQRQSRQRKESCQRSGNGRSHGRPMLL
jgi:hypothetical protein